MKIKKKEAVILKKNKDINTRTFTFGGKNAGKDSPPEPYVLRKQYTKLGRLIKKESLNRASQLQEMCWNVKAHNFS